MKEAGCWLVAFGIESGAQQVLDSVTKDTTVQKSRNAITMIDRVGLHSWGYFIIGLPGETKETIRKTIDFAKSLPLDLALFHVAVPYPGTEFYFQALAEGWLRTREWSLYDMNDSAVVGYPGLSPEEIVAGVKQAFREFYLRPRQIWRLARMLLKGGNLGVPWHAARAVLSWASKGKGGGMLQAGSLAAEIDAYDHAVVEATHVDSRQRKPSHRMYELVSENRGEQA